MLERLHKVLLGKASDVAAGMRRSATLRNLSNDDREAVGFATRVGSEPGSARRCWPSAG